MPNFTRSPSGTNVPTSANNGTDFAAGLLQTVTEMETRPRARYRSDGTQSFANNAQAAVTFQVEDYDIGFNLAPALSYITIPRTGIYIATAFVAIDGLSLLTVDKASPPTFSGTTPVLERSSPAAWGTGLADPEDTLSGHFLASAGDRIALRVRQASGGAKTILFASFEIAYLGA